MGGYVALYDACVFYPAPLRDFLIRLAMTDLFRARWTQQIHAEWTRNLLANRPDLTVDRLRRTIRLANKAVPDALVTGYEPLIKTLALPDPEDRHVLAAAIVGRADTIVTFNLKHFPLKILDRYNIEPQHPDDFIVRQMDISMPLVVRAARQQRASLTRKPKTVHEFLLTLMQQGLPQATDRLREYSELI
jgi:hypothetical protein